MTKLFDDSTWQGIQQAADALAQHSAVIDAANAAAAKYSAVIDAADANFAKDGLQIPAATLTERA